MTTVDSWPKTLPMPSVGSWNSTTETHLISLIAHSNFKELAKDTPIIVHGHSLGSGISVEVLANLCQDQNKCPPTALILGKSLNLSVSWKNLI